MSDTYLRIKNELILSALTDSQFRTLLYLMSKSNKQKCFPSIRTIATELDKSTTSIQKTLKDLEVQGYLTKSNRKTTTGKTTSNEYQLKEDLFVKRKKREPNICEVVEEKEYSEEDFDISDYDWIGE